MYIFCYLIGTEIEERFYLVGNLFFLWAGSAQHDLPVRASALTVPVHRASLTVCLHTIRIPLERIAQLVFHGANLFLACYYYFSWLWVGLQKKENFIRRVPEENVTNREVASVTNI